MKLLLSLFITGILAGCGGGGGEVVIPENPSETPPPGSMEQAESAGDTSSLSLDD